MRVAVAGDTHGKIDKLALALQMLKPDHLFFTGDFYGDGAILTKRLGISWHGVMGNCDFGRRGKQEQRLTYARYCIYLVHGHQFGVKRSLNSLFYKAQEVEADIVLFGHTHVPICEKIEGIWFINPGSASLPRVGLQSSYALIDFSDNKINAMIIEI